MWDRTLETPHVLHGTREGTGTKTLLQPDADFGRSSPRGLSNSELLCPELLAHAGNHPSPANLSLLEHSRKGETGLLFPRPEQTARKAHINLKSQLGLESTRRGTTIFGGSPPAQGAPSAPLQSPPPSHIGEPRAWSYHLKPPASSLGNPKIYSADSEPSSLPSSLLWSGKQEAGLTSFPG